MTFRHLLTVIIFLLAAGSCRNKQGENHLPAKTMQSILLDIHTAEAYSNMVADSLHKLGTKNYDSLGIYYKEIFEHYHVTSQQFMESLEWYKRNPNDMDTMYAEMQKTINTWQANSDKARRRK